MLKIVLAAIILAGLTVPGHGYNPEFNVDRQRLMMAVTKGAERRVYVFPQVFPATDAPCEAARKEIRRTTKLAPGARLYLECVPAFTDPI